ncbi:uncharacterized protein LOC122054717 [Zingiber officinale]|uniref:Uncharacterized protein n=1 Tax=Zingiber officinale TaxID=94328 RepID=A0A8J5HAW8_ZINOF|nr:uncharacterized protein LOC122054717 [Zingiber officinale]KAG6517662.1 hypothetical protein ZIOFF_021058 [Zingiber officinale]
MSTAAGVKSPSPVSSASLLIRRRGKPVPALLDLAPLAAAPPQSTKVEGEYTSLRDVMGVPPPAPGLSSPVATPGGEIRIKNRLVQQAAQAYLQPTPTAASSHRRRGILLTSDDSCGEHLSDCLRFFGGLWQSLWHSFFPLESRSLLVIHIKC